VFFRLRRHSLDRGNPRVVDHSDTGIDGTALRQTREMQERRRSAAGHAGVERVAAAASRDADVRYRAFVAALADEEPAAAGSHG